MQSDHYTVPAQPDADQYREYTIPAWPPTISIQCSSTNQRASIRSDKAVTDTWYCDQSEGHIRVYKQEAHYATTHLAC